MYDGIVKRYMPHCISDLPGLTPGAVNWKIEVVSFKEIDPKKEIKAGIAENSAGYLLSAEGGVRAQVSKDLKEVVMQLADYNFEYGEFTSWIALASMLRIYLSLALPRQNTLMFHAASLADGNLGRIFMGPSGAGKSTVCSLGEGRAVFNDEASFLKHEEDGWKVYHSPFFSNEDWPKHQSETLPLAGIYLLYQDNKDYLEPLSPASSMGEVMSCIMNFRDDSQTAAILLDLCADLLTDFPPHRMHFTKSTNFWKNISGK